MRDERTTQVMHRIYAELFTIIIIISALSLVVKVLFMEKNLNDCSLEWLILVGSPVYQFIRARMLKIGMTSNTSDKKHLIRSLFASLAATTVIFGFAALVRPEKFSWTSIFSFMVPYAVLLVLFRFIFLKIEQRQAKKLSDEYDD